MDPSEINILVVDDEPDIQDIIKDLFEIFGFKVDTADSGNKAWAIMQSKDFEVVISDVRMSDGSGPELLEMIKDRDVDKPKVFFISGYMDYTLEQVFELGVDGLFSKPFEASLLRESIKRAFMPLKNKWSKEITMTPKLKLEKNLVSYEDAREKRQLSFGRGGFFVSIDDEKIKPGELIDFDFKFSDEECPALTGRGQVKWVHEKEENGLPKGIGVEIMNLGPECIDYFIEWLGKNKFKSYIPQS